MACTGAVSRWRLAALDPLGLTRASSRIPVLERVGDLERVAFSGVAPLWVPIAPFSKPEDVQLRSGPATLEVPGVLC